MTLTVEAVKREVKKRVEYHVTVLTYNELTEKYEPLWSVIQSEPFTVKVETSALTKLE